MKKITLVLALTLSLGVFAQNNEALKSHFKTFYKQMKKHIFKLALIQ